MLRSLKCITFKHRAGKRECMILEKKFNEIKMLKKSRQSDNKKVVHTDMYVYNNIKKSHQSTGPISK